jgi:hypothetical protein
MSHKDVILEIHSRLIELKNGVGDTCLSRDDNNRLVVILKSYECDDNGNETVKTWELTVKDMGIKP